jgi:hypothetical protein
VPHTYHTHTAHIPHTHHTHTYKFCLRTGNNPLYFSPRQPPAASRQPLSLSSSFITSHDDATRNNNEFRSTEATKSGGINRGGGRGSPRDSAAGCWRGSLPIFLTSSDGNARRPRSSRQSGYSSSSSDDDEGGFRSSVLSSAIGQIHWVTCKYVRCQCIYIGRIGEERKLLAEAVEWGCWGLLWTAVFASA